MAMTNVPLGLVLLVLVSHSLLSTYLCSADEEKKVYIAYMGALPKDKLSVASVHNNLLSSVLENSSPSESLIHSYGKSFNGFAAKLTEAERQKLSEMDGVLSVFPNRIYWPQTTRSWDFLGFDLTVPRQLNLERDVIVGMIDTGIWPESESFNDTGLGPPPKKWKGSCKNFPCNNKIIGARFYRSRGDRNGTNTSMSARDTQGHGTHTASTVAGVVVKNASLNHIAEGTARGAVPSARLAIYKVCWPREGCRTADLLAAFNDAIEDGVDIISISIGGREAGTYLEDPIAIGSFHAMMFGILTSASAGNNGPFAGSISNVAPWLMSVAASSTDRKIVTKLELGDKKIIEGRAVTPFDSDKKFRPLIPAYENFGCINVGPEVKGKIVFCNEVYFGDGPQYYGAYGQVKVSPITDFARAFDIPSTVLSTNDTANVTRYIKNTRKPVANIHRSEGVFDSDAPSIVSFSSRGPNSISPGVLKPDVAAPGVDILAAWNSEETSAGNIKYNIISGTSMACPHATGAAAYVKSFHPDWSASAIRSALMTTATPMSATRNMDAEFAYGSGQIDPVKAVKPGLVFETSFVDYTSLLCSENYTTEQIRRLSGENISCPVGKHTDREFNYPSIAYLARETAFNVSFPRTVTNVGPAKSEYKVKITSDPNITVTINPEVLRFKSQNETVHEKQKFTVTISSKGLPHITASYSASIVWSDGEHIVRSPVTVYHNV